MKKILSLCLVLVLAVALALPCFASGLLPSLPSSADFENWIVAYDEIDGYVAINHRFRNEEKPTQYYQWHIYMLENGNWKKFYSWDMNNLYWDIPNETVVYDSTGVLANKISFATASKDFYAVLDKFTEQISVQAVVQVLVVGATAVVGLAFMWWGVRKLSSALFKAFRKGKVSL